MTSQAHRQARSRNTPDRHPTALSGVRTEQLVAGLGETPDTGQVAELLWRLGDEATGSALLYSLPPAFILERLPALVTALREEAYSGDVAAAAALFVASRSPRTTPASYVTRGVLGGNHIGQIASLVQRWAEQGSRAATQALEIVSRRTRGRG